jgi:acyl-coenzyme A thioesterase 9
MADSYCEVLLPFRTEPKLAEEYASIYGGIRVGKLLEDLDVLAASIAYIHCDDLDLTIVTAAIDRIDLLLPIDGTLSDVRLRGSVTYVGKSSIEVTISVETDQTNSSNDTVVWELAALAKFILVARTPSGAKSVPVNRLALESEREKEICMRGQQRQEYRRMRLERSLFKHPPAEGEVKLVHEICMGGRMPSVVDDSAFPLKQVPMESTKASSLRICHPQEQNIHGYMFGGYLCREAFELAFATATVFFLGKRPCLKSIDDIVFVHPVPIGSIMDLKAEVIHSRLHEGELYACIQVIADIINPDTQSRLTTNTFHFTLTHPISSFTGTALPAILPNTYVEAMKFLEGKRRVDFDLESTMSQSNRDMHLLNPPHYDPSLDKTK